MEIMRVEFHLVGPRKGQTMVINVHPFGDGICTMVQSTANMGTAARVLSFYGAYARGTPEYDAAMAAEEAEHGTDEAGQKALEGVDPPVRSVVRPDGSGPSEGAADVSGGDVDPGGLLTRGHRHDRGRVGGVGSGAGVVEIAAILGLGGIVELR